ncbi:hypothetical protein KVT40_001719 [Elsinoe batatas]|uniref:Protein kinase domain-containing protein n=1 Tax=Elsinoe batatas TaxID=2601811 RepID=A0A8K0L9Q5_9PEZI|nr:hypothetical protein KVT40_001719 [Elsinoe batatas]
MGNHVSKSKIASEEGISLLEDWLRESQLLQIPDEKIYPTISEALSPLIIATDLCNDHEYFINRPKLHYHDAGIETFDIADVFCADIRNRVVGYLTERHTEDLSVIMRTQPRRTLALNVDAIMADISAGISHLHSYGLAHNWLMPEHIVLDKQDRAVIIHLQAPASATTLVFAGPSGIPPLHGVPAQSHARTIPSQGIGVAVHGNTDCATATSCDGSKSKATPGTAQI